MCTLMFGGLFSFSLNLFRVLLYYSITCASSIRRNKTKGEMKHEGSLRLFSDFRLDTNVRETASMMNCCLMGSVFTFI